MPGLKELERARPGRIRIEYREIPRGAKIAYSTASPELIDAIHRWFGRPAGRSRRACCIRPRGPRAGNAIGPASTRILQRSLYRNEPADITSGKVVVRPIVPPQPKDHPMAPAHKTVVSFQGSIRVYPCSFVVCC